MARYFFAIHDTEVVPDPEGIELPDAAAAMARAMVEARELAAESVRQGHFDGHHRIDVTDEAGACVGAVRFDEAVAIR
jgi:hypothetical protein